MFISNYLIISILMLNTVCVFGLNNFTIDNISVSSNLTAESDLWLILLRECKIPTVSCISRNIYEYLRSIFDNTDNIQFTNYLKFSRNSVDYNEFSSLFGKSLTTAENVMPSFNATTNIEEMSRSLNENTVKFLMTHDIELKLPENIFLGTSLKVSPRSFENNGALIKFEILPKTQSVEEGRLFKKIRQFISQRLIYALLAILLVIKLLAVKVLFVLPTIVGVAAAKKLLLKVLLFIFPALHHLFKLCAYVPHGAKHHIHKHQISHIHEIGHDYHHHHGHGPYHRLHEPVEVIEPQFKGLPSSKHYGNYHEEPDHLSSFGPYYGTEIIDHRYDHNQEDNEVDIWGHYKPNQVITKTAKTGAPLVTAEIENILQKTKYDSLMKERLRKEKHRIHEENLRLQDQLNIAVKLHGKLKQATNMFDSKIPQAKFTPYNQNNSIILTHDKLLQISFPKPSVSSLGVHLIQPPTSISSGTIKSHIKSLQNTLPPAYAQSIPKFIENPMENKNYSKSSDDQQHIIYEKVAITYDPFYSPILEKIDRILVGLGFMEEPCRERLICSMYKNPSKYSPQSNLLSAELSRDSKDLQKPSTSNSAAIRFHRYVQAARDGQDKRNCMRLYPACGLNTEL